MASKFRFRRSFGNVSSRFRGAIPKHFPLFTGLLDNFGGAAAAYSLRALSANWVAGDVVEVRRSSDSTTQDFTASQITNGELETFCGVGDGFVSIWYDQSGNANNATQATTTMQPKIVSAGALVVGGLDFDGVDDQMMVVGNPVITAAAAGTFSTFSVHTVAAVEAGYLFGNPSTGAGAAQYARSGDEFTTSNGTNTTLDKITGSSSELLLSGVYNNGDAGLLINGGGSMTDQGTYDFVAGTVDFTIGNRSGGVSSATFLAGQIQEIIVYNSNQSANRVAIETNINAAYTIF